MLYRIDSFFDWFQIPDAEKNRANGLIEDAIINTNGMMHQRDFESLAAGLLHYRPKKIFEIGTYKGVTTNFICNLLPDVRIVTIAYVRPKIKWLGKNYNNSSLSKKHVGSYIERENQEKITQLIGDSHAIVPESFIEEHGSFDWIFIDGDHTAEGVAQDTLLARELLDKDGTICWHDANPRKKYIDVKAYLEDKIPFTALATQDNYTGGIAMWNNSIEENIHSCRLPLAVN